MRSVPAAPRFFDLAYRPVWLRATILTSLIPPVLMTLTKRSSGPFNGTASTSGSAKWCRNLSAMDRPLAWTQHVTLSPPFLDPATTQFRASKTRSVVSQADPGFNAYLTPGREFSWPIAPRRDGGESDLRQMHKTAPASGYTAHLADPQRDHAYFVAFTPRFRQAFGYVWKRADFPWLGIWEENCSRQASPWDGKTVTRGMEFGVSPFPETRREMVDRNRLLNAAAYKWIASRGRLDAEYWISSQVTDVIPESLTWPKVS